VITEPVRSRLERWLVILVSLHSYAVAFGLLFLTEWGAHFGGWETVTPLFFPRQGGVFHLLLASAYLYDYVHYKSVTFLITAKFTATVFLGAMWAIDGGPWLVPASLAGDLIMGLAVLAIRKIPTTPN
jgi:hypothetical protein